MKKTFLTSIISLFLSLLFASKNEKYSSINIPFALEENLGQIASTDGSTVLFRAAVPGLQFFVKTDGISWQFEKLEFENSGSNKFTKVKTHETYRMDVRFIGMQAPSKITKEGKSSYHKNYFTHDVMNVHDYEKVTLHNVYAGIDWIIYSKNNTLKYDFVVHPGADPNLIKFQTYWNDNLTLNTDGGYTITCPMGKIEELLPISFQENRSIKTSVVKNGQYYQFKTAPYDSKKSLTIDPPLIWTYSSSLTVAPYHLATNSMDISANGNVLVCGATYGAGSLAGGGFQNTAGGSLDGFFASFTPAGSLNWLSYYGGTEFDRIEGIDCYTDGSFAICGSTESETGIASGGFQNSISSGMRSGFLAKFNAAGSRLWGTYIHFADQSDLNSCTFDNTGNIWAVGNTEGDAPTIGGFQTNNAGGVDGLILKVSSGGGLLWSSLLGGSVEENLLDCTIDPSGNLIAVGVTGGSTNNINYSGFQPILGGLFDGIVMKISNSGTMIWSSYLGGTGYDELRSVRSLSSGDIIVAGESSSSSLATPGASQTTLGGSQDDILCRIASTGSITWLTYLGGSETDYSEKIAIGPNNNILWVGSTYSTDFPILNADQNSYGGNFDGFVAQFSATGTKIFTTYYGGSAYDFTSACAVDNNNDFYISGSFVGSFFGVASSVLGFSPMNMYLNKYCAGELTPTIQISSNLSTYCSGQDINLLSSVTNAGSNPTYEWYINGVLAPELGNSSSLTHSINTETQLTLNLSCNLLSDDPCATTEAISNTITITVLPEIPTPIISVSGNVLEATLSEHYQWYLNGNPVGVDDQYHTATVSGVYTVAIRIDNCWSEQSAPVTITGAYDLEELGIYMYPNPVDKGEITISTPQSCTMEIFEISGKLLNQYELNAGKQKIDIGNLTPAVYIVSINKHFKKLVVSQK